ncbi:hypothetical protein Golob_000088 [Gossypium lobatum]|uniref:Uncharacterized protein n=1 Tax=Gossypium lobatum TaxID=34289 RepID=A0A7J8NH89_9ROSI|nr:hypothetical protein [Gossypium lobatum]
MGLPVDTVKARLKDKNSPCISWSDIRDAMGKANGDRHLALFTPIEEFLESEWPPNQSIKEWSMVLIKCDGHLWVPLIGIWGAISYSSLMVLSKYRYDQCVPTIAGLNKVEVSIQDSRF